MSIKSIGVDQLVSPGVYDVIEQSQIPLNTQYFVSFSRIREAIGEIVRFSYISRRVMNLLLSYLLGGKSALSHFVSALKLGKFAAITDALKITF